MGGFLSHEGGGGGQGGFDICHKKVVFLNEGFPKLETRSIVKIWSQSIPGPIDIQKKS